MTGRRVIAVIPAAGRGRRMGQIKQLLPLGGSTMMETVIAKAVASSVDGVAVVVNDAVRSAAERHVCDRCRIAVNPDPDSDMLRSIQIGWQTAVEAFGLFDADGIMLLPVDQPGVSPNAIASVVDAFRAGEVPSAVIASYGGKSGHPAIYPSGWIAETLTWSPGVGLNELGKRHAGDVVLVAQRGEVPIDINTTLDFERHLTSGD